MPWRGPPPRRRPKSRCWTGLRQSLGELLDDPNRTDLDSYFFRYRDATGRWRLVWCWGFQRSDGEPAPAVVCTAPECNLLFVRRPKQSPKCPGSRHAHRPRQGPPPQPGSTPMAIGAAAAGWAGVVVVGAPAADYGDAGECEIDRRRDCGCDR